VTFTVCSYILLIELLEVIHLFQHIDVKWSSPCNSPRGLPQVVDGDSGQHVWVDVAIAV